MDQLDLPMLTKQGKSIAVGVSPPVDKLSLVLRAITIIQTPPVECLGLVSQMSNGGTLHQPAAVSQIDSVNVLASSCAASIGSVSVFLHWRRCGVDVIGIELLDIQLEAQPRTYPEVRLCRACTRFSFH